MDPDSKWNPFGTERRIVVLTAILFVANLLLSVIWKDRFLQAYEHLWPPSLQWIRSTPGLLASAAIIGVLLTLYRHADRKPGHWLKETSVIGIRGHLFLFGMAIGGVAGLVLQLMLKALGIIP